MRVLKDLWYIFLSAFSKEFIYQAYEFFLSLAITIWRLAQTDEKPIGGLW
jgi:hypothetical protein